MGQASLFVRSFGVPGPAGTLVFIHATGLNASSYAHLLSNFPFDGRILAFSMRGHGATDLPADPHALLSWQTFADDLVSELESLRLQEPITLMGHSAGAVTALLTARSRRPQRLLMIEPVVLPVLAVQLARSPLKRFTIGQTPIARQAAARRSNFPSRQAVERAYAEKRFFRHWQPEALAGYLDEGLRPSAGDSVELSCSPAYEAACFSAQAAGFWPHLEHVLSAGVDVSVLASSRGSTFPALYHGRARRMGADVCLEAGSHMMPMEEPESIRAWAGPRLQP